MKYFLLTSALHCWRRSEGSPELFGAYFTTGWHVEADGHKLMTLQHHRHNLVSIRVTQHWRSSIVIRLARLSLPSIQHLSIRIRKLFQRKIVDVHLEYSWNLLGVCSDNITLGHRSHVKHLRKVKIVKMKIIQCFYLVEIKNESRITVLLVHLTVEEDDLSLGHHHVQLLPAVPPDVLLAGCLQPTLQTSLSITNL